MELEKADSGSIKMFRESGCSLLLIPAECGGVGATPLEAIQIQRAIGSRAPSLAIATTMHHFSIASIVEMSQMGSGLESLLLEGIAQKKLLVASGFAEGQISRGILSPIMHAKTCGKNFIVNGIKKPCSLTWSMDLLTVSLTVGGESETEQQLAVALIPVESEGIERKKFWNNWVLAGAESDEVILNNVVVPEQLVFRIGSTTQLDSTQISGFLWFELLITASYLGIASALVERVIKNARGSYIDRAVLGSELEGAMLALEGMARSMMVKLRDSDELARMLFVRYAVQQAIARASLRAVEILGGMAFISSSESSYLLAATRALAFHPPSQLSMAESLSEYLNGQLIKIQ
jgi:alkylation response protein AidB-like acyl-CoA dehydrogenase